MEDKDKRLIEFLLHSYFGMPDINLQSVNKETARRNCAQRAYRDLVRTIKYTYSTTALEKLQNNGGIDLVKKYNNCKTDAVKRVCQAISNAIGDYPDGKCFDEWHKDICEEIICNIMQNAMCDETPLVSAASFHFGQAQKWLNMTLKYCWLLNLLPDTFPVGELHIPVDSYIIDCLWDVEGLTTKKAFPGVKTAIKNRPDNARPSSYIKSWSTWTYQEYADFRNALKAHSENNNIKYDLEWEHTSWIEMAKQRAND